MEKDLKISRFGIQFGEELDQEDCSQTNLSIDFSQKLTNDSMEKLQTSSKGQIDINKACVIELMTASPEHAQELQQLIIQITNMKTEENNVEKFGAKGALLGAFITGAISSGTLIIKTCIHSTDQRRVMVSVKGSDKLMGEFIEPLETLIESGLQNISNNTGNSIEVNILCQKFDHIINQLMETQNIFSSFLSKIKIEGIVKLHKFLADTLSQVFNNIDPDFNQSPPMMFLKYFKMIDVELRFNSVEELPVPIRQKIYNPWKKYNFCKFNFNIILLKALENKMNLEENKVFEKLENLIAGQIIFHANLMNFITCKLNIQSQGFGKFFEIIYAAASNDILKNF